MHYELGPYQYDSERDQLFLAGGMATIDFPYPRRRTLLVSLIKAGGRPITAERIAAESGELIKIDDVPRIFDDLLALGDEGSVKLPEAWRFENTLSRTPDGYYCGKGQERDKPLPYLQKTGAVRVDEVGRTHVSEVAEDSDSQDRPCSWSYDAETDCLEFDGQVLKLPVEENQRLLIRVVQSALEGKGYSIRDAVYDFSTDDTPVTSKKIRKMFMNLGLSTWAYGLLESDKGSSEARSPRAFLQDMGGVLYAFSLDQIKARIGNAINSGRAEWAYDVHNETVFVDGFPALQPSSRHKDSVGLMVVKALMDAFPERLKSPKLRRELREQGYKISPKKIRGKINNINEHFRVRFGVEGSVIYLSEANDSFSFDLSPQEVKRRGLERDVGLKEIVKDDISVVLYRKYGRGFVGHRSEIGEWDYRPVGIQETGWKLLRELLKTPDVLLSPADLKGVLGDKKPNKYVDSLRRALNNAHPECMAGDAFIHSIPHKGFSFGVENHDPRKKLKGQLVRAAYDAGFAYPEELQYGQLTLDFNDLSIRYDGREVDLALPYVKTLFRLAVVRGKPVLAEELGEFANAEVPLSESTIKSQVSTLRKKLDKVEDGLSSVIVSNPPQPGWSMPEECPEVF